MKKNHKFLFTLLMAIVMMAMSPHKLWADETHTHDYGETGICSCGQVEAAVTDTDGYYKITNPGNLVWYKNLVNNGTNISAKGKLTKDIDMTGVAFAPIGNYTAAQRYSGKFNGQNFSIKNLTINGGSSYTGFIGYTSKDGSVKIEIKDLNLVDVNLSSSNDVGGIVCELGCPATITNCHVTGNLESTGAFAGGIVSYHSAGNITISNCSFNGNATGKEATGGIIGQTRASTISDCTAAGVIKSSASQGLGGIVGWFVHSDAKNTICNIQNCKNEATIQGTSTIEGVGGILGYVDAFVLKTTIQASTANITACINSGDITASNGTGVGGIFGKGNNAYATANITSCASNGNVTSTSNAGGCVGSKAELSSSSSFANNVVASTNFFGNTADYDASQNTVVTAEKFAAMKTSGALAFALNGKTSGGSPFYQNLDNGSTIDDAPVTDNTHGLVHLTKYYCENNEGEFSNTAVEEVEYVHYFAESTNGFCESCNAPQPAELDATDNYYKIGNPGNLVWFSNLVNNGTDVSANAKLTKDIDMAGVAFSPIGKKVYDSSTKTFINGYNGKFDGQNFSIKNLTIDCSISKLSAGLFGYTCGDNSVEIKDLTLKDVNITSPDEAGGIVGCAKCPVTITNCHVTGNVKTTGYYVGGIVSYATGAITISNSSFNGNASGSVYGAGGIVGKALATTTISNCTTAGVIKNFKNTGLGGIVGGFGKNATCTIEKCKNEATITQVSTSTGSVEGVGGILGYIEGDMYSSGKAIANITACINSGDITAHNGIGVGGIFGKGINNTYSVVNITSCASSGNVTGNTNVGGCVGSAADISSSSSFVNNVVVGTNFLGNTADYDASKNTVVTAEKFATMKTSGALAYALNGKQNGGTTFYQNLDNGATVDAAPVTDNTHGLVYLTKYYCETNEGEFSNTAVEKSEYVHNYDNTSGFCLSCNDLQPAELDATDNYYKITNPGNLVWFSNLINGGTNASGKLMKDIDLSSVCHEKDEANGIAEANWTPIGTDTKPFKGTFDGQSFSITNMYIYYTTGYKGLFGKTDGATVKNFSIGGNMGSKTSNSGATVQCIGGVIGWAYNSTIEDITSSVNIELKGGTEQKLMGGVVGDCDGTTISGCLYNGTLNAGNSGDCVGGITGYFRCDAQTTKAYQIINCCNAGSVTTTAESNAVAGILGYSNDGKFMGAHNCLNVGKITTGSSTTGAIYGRYRKTEASVGSNNYYKAGTATRGVAQDDSSQKAHNVCTAVSEDDLTSGKVCYLLNGKTSTGTIAWYQKLGTPGDANPVLKKDGNNNTVYCGYVACKQTYANTNTELTQSQAAHDYVDGICKVCNAYEPATLVTAENATTLGVSADYVGYYAITKATELAWFANAVNDQNDTYKDAKVVLTADIDLSSVCGEQKGNWTPIGKELATFIGTFDGQGHSITGMSILNYTTDCQGLFGAVAGTHPSGHAQLKNFSVSGTMTSSINGLRYIAGVVGMCDYVADITDVTNKVNITIAKDLLQQHIGGVAGYCSRTDMLRCVNNGNIDAGASTECIGGLQGYTTGYSAMKYCLNTGYLTTTADNAYIGGILGYQNSEKKFSGCHNCLNTGAVNGGTKNTYAGAIFGRYRANANSVGNYNYYLETSATKAYGANESTDDLNTPCNAVTAEQLASGYTCWRLNGKTSNGTLNWYQTINTDNIPVLDNTHKVVAYDGTNYINVIALGTCGDCTWVIDCDSALVIRPTTGESATLGTWSKDASPWKANNAADIKTVSFQGTVNAGTSIRGMFASCPNLISIDFTNFNTDNVTNMQNLTNGSTKLETINFGSTFSTANVANMNYMFKNCNALKSLNLSGFTSEKLTSTVQMFHGCSALTSLTFGENFTCASVTDMSNMFYNAGLDNGSKNSLTLDLSHFNTANVTTMASMFQDCKAKAIIFSSSFSTAKVTTMNQLFRDCYNLTSVDLSHFNTENVTDMSYMFYNCKRFTSLDLSSFNTAKVENMENMFNQYYNGNGPSSLTIGNFDMSNVTNSTDMYSNIYPLKTLTLKAVPFLKDQTFNSKFTGKGVTVNYELDDNSVIYTGTNYLPAATAAPTYTRDIAATSNWGTIVLPFEAKSDANVQLYELTAVSGTVMTFSPVATVAANTPCVFKKKTAGATSVTFTANSTTAAPAAATIAEPDAVNGLAIKGTYTQLTNQTGMYFIAQDKFWKAESPITINPFRAWFEGTLPSGAKEFTIVIDDEATGVLQMENGELKMQNTGKYMENGRIVIVKNGKKYNANGQAVK